MFYVIIIKNDSESIFKFGNQDTAMERFHSEMSYAYNQHIETSVFVTDKNFSNLKRGVYSITASVIENLEAEPS